MWQDLRAYYRAVAPFYEAEMAAKDDLPRWAARVRELHPRRVLDLGCGGARLGAALRRDDPQVAVVGVDLLDVLAREHPLSPFVRADMRSLPFRPGFDLVAAANDPFAHLLLDGDREAAVREARRVLRPGGRAIIDGLWDPPRERVRDLRDGTRIAETWSPLGNSVYEVRYRYTRAGRSVEAGARLRAWRHGEPALAGAEIAGTYITFR